MDPQTDLPELVEDLEVNIDELTSTLEPLLAKPLHTTASSLPLLDKAKTYVLAAYTIESLLFSSLKASGIDATEHAVYKEIARLKEYNRKIKEVEERGTKGSAEGRARLDVGAAQRFIKHGLSGNDKYDLERQERMAKEKARAHLKAQQINKKFDDDGNEMQSEGATPKKRGVEQVDGAAEDDDEEVLSGLDGAQPATKKARVEGAEPMDIDSEPAASSQSPAKQTKKDEKAEKAKKKEAKKAEKKAKQSAESTDADTEDKAEDSMDLSVAADEAQEEAEADTPPPQPKKRGRPPKKDKIKAKQGTDDDQEEAKVLGTTPSKQEARVTRKRNARLSNQQTQDEDIEANEEAIVPIPDRAPKTRSETFNALLDGSMQEKQKKGKASARGKGRRGRGK